MSVDNVKHKLQIPEANKAHDEHVKGALLAARRRVIERTGLDLDGEGVSPASIVDTFRSVHSGSPILLSRRPVAAITTAEIRGYAASAQWTAVGADLVDAAAGELVLTSDAQPFWPPQESRPAWYRWRDPIHPLVRVTYTTSVYEAPEDLAQAIEDLAAYWYGQARANVAASVSVGGISQSFRGDAIPEWISARLAPYERGRRAMWV